MNDSQLLKWMAEGWILGVREGGYPYLFDRIAALVAMRRPRACAIEIENLPRVIRAGALHELTERREAQRLGWLEMGLPRGFRYWALIQ